MRSHLCPDLVGAELAPKAFSSSHPRSLPSSFRMETLPPSLLVFDFYRSSLGSEQARGVGGAWEGHLELISIGDCS